METTEDISINHHPRCKDGFYQITTLGFKQKPDGFLDRFPKKENVKCHREIELFVANDFKLFAVTLTECWRVRN